jgi:hypothetical protein
MINKDLAKLRGIPLEDQVHIEDLQNLLTKWCAAPWDYFNTPQEAVEVITVSEYTLQRLWRFPENSDFHTWWLRLAKHRCPVMDNEERIGTPYKVIVCSCPYYGNNKATSWDDERFQ